MIIHRLPALSDNYIFVLEDESEHTAAVVDPAESLPVLNFLRLRNLKLTKIFNTHHHSDHVGGNKGLLAEFPQTVVYAGENDLGRIPGQTVCLQDNDLVNFSNRNATVFFTPGHTKGHIVYYFYPDDSNPGDLFCGDTLFGTGCGKLFEGTFEQMYGSLKKLRSLPDQTRVWCAHEYTLENIQIAIQLDRKCKFLENRLHNVSKMYAESLPTIPLNLGEEKKSSPFLRWDDPSLQEQVDARGDELLTFTRVRQFRDRY